MAGKNTAAFGIFRTIDQTERAANALMAAGFSTQDISVLMSDTHSTREFGLVRYGLDQARRAGLTKKDVLNCLAWSKFCRLMKR